MSDELKHLGASLASYGSMAMFHMVGATPEAPTAEAAFGGAAPAASMTVTDADVQAVFDAYQYKDGGSNIVVFSGPQLSLYEMQSLSERFEGRRVAPGMTVVVTTNHMIYSDAKRLGYVGVLEAAGVTILQGVCFYILQRLSKIREENGWTNLISNSGQAGQHHYRPSFQHRLAPHGGLRGHCLHGRTPMSEVLRSTAPGDRSSRARPWSCGRVQPALRPGPLERRDLAHRAQRGRRIHQGSHPRHPDRQGRRGGRLGVLRPAAQGIAPKALVFGKLNPVMVQGSRAGRHAHHGRIRPAPAAGHRQRDRDPSGSGGEIHHAARLGGARAPARARPAPHPGAFPPCLNSRNCLRTQSRNTATWWLCACRFRVSM